MRRLKLLCTDLDRTLLPNGAQQESANARQLLAEQLRRETITLAFVTGRDHGLVRQAIAEYQLPWPDFVIADVGSMVYHCQQDNWSADSSWHDVIGADWHFAHGEQLHAWVRDMGLPLQEAAKQGRYKLSYYTPLDFPQSGLLQQMQQRFEQQGVRCHLIFSIDEAKGIGLLDVLPAAAGKLPALLYLVRYLNLTLDTVLFAGDSGNDLDVLTSAVPSVLVANAMPDVIASARMMAQSKGHGEQLYVASGQVGNGCYAAGILEGIQHFYPLQGQLACSL